MHFFFVVPQFSVMPCTECGIVKLAYVASLQCQLTLYEDWMFNIMFSSIIERFQNPLQIQVYKSLKRPYSSCI